MKSFIDYDELDNALLSYEVGRKSVDDLTLWYRANVPSDDMIWKTRFDDYYMTLRDFIKFTLFRDFYTEDDHTYRGLLFVIGEHYSKSIKHPAIGIKYKGLEIAFRNNFHDYEVAVISDRSLDLDLYTDIFKSRSDGRYFYQGIPKEYQLTEKYEDNNQRFMCDVRNTNHMLILLYLLRKTYDNSKSKGEN